MVATALNDYVATLPLQELYQYPVMLAFKMNGEYLKIKDKGRSGSSIRVISSPSCATR